MVIIAIPQIRLSCQEVREGLGKISYDKLWNTMKKRKISQYALKKKYGISPGQITRLKRNESVSTHTIEMFCKILSCDISDIMQYIPDETDEK